MDAGWLGYREPEVQFHRASPTGPVFARSARKSPLTCTCASNGSSMINLTRLYSFIRLTASARGVPVNSAAVEFRFHSENESTERWSELTSTCHGPVTLTFSDLGSSRSTSIASLRLRLTVIRRGKPRRFHDHLSAELTNANSSFELGSPSMPRLALIRPWLLSFAPKTFTGTPACFNTAPRRIACAVLSG